MSHEQALQKLRLLLANVAHESSDALFRVAARIRDAKPNVIGKYAPLFTLPNVDTLTAEDFQSFLLFKNNQYWDNLQRQGGWMTGDMPRLREGIKLLIDEHLPLRTRLNRLRPTTGPPMSKGLGRAAITAILQVVYPDKYGVWNNTAEQAMRELGLWPETAREAGFGERYEAMNRAPIQTAEELGIDLWTLDMLWWRVSPHMPKGAGEEEGASPVPVETVLDETIAPSEGSSAVFGLERHLHEFLVDNWGATELGEDWDLYEEDGEIVGSRYDTGEVGEIDLLAKHKRENRWLVVELKRNQTSDATVGQVLRYMGWVRKKLVTDGSEVEGLVICREIDDKLRYALDGQPNIRCMTYQVSFSLIPAPAL